MDIVTALIFTHYLYYFINDRINEIDSIVYKAYDCIVGNEEQEVKRELQP